MNAILAHERQAKLGFHITRPVRHAAPPTAKKPRRWWRWLVIAVVATTLVWCHGCHGGDHDDELIVWLLDW